ncbi:MAG: trypsin-like peptidase domain-containing protein, partial [Candidatus Granulicatella sp. P6S_S16_bin.50.1]|nr:trypsin-like peptidase domain-containing protein [Candidatus Granulicatella sp. P6S_S16_bin.50.1]
AVTNPANQATTPATQASQTQVEPTKTSTASQGATDITKVVAEVKNAVVSVINKQSTSRNSLSGTQQSSGELATASEGSGVIYKNADGYAYIVTNYHVIANSQELEVLLADGTRAKAEIVGSDQWTDLAVIRIANTNVTTVAEFANSDDVQVGQTAIAIGSPLGSEFATSVTQGIVSATNRSVATDVDGDGQEDWVVTAIQTDAAINPGNSGGALINSAGQVIGINSMKISKSSVEGMGFAIPSNEVVSIIKQLEENGKITRPALGISMVNLTSVNTRVVQQMNLPSDVKSGVVIAEVASKGSAKAAGLQAYDVIVEMDGQKIEGIQNLRKVLYSHKVGDKLEVTYYRNGQKQTTTISLTETNSPSL